MRSGDSIAGQQAVRRRPRRRMPWWLGSGLGGLVLLAAGVLYHLNDVPADLNLSAILLTFQ